MSRSGIIEVILGPIHNTSTVSPRNYQPLRQHLVPFINSEAVHNININANMKFPSILSLVLTCLLLLPSHITALVGITNDPYNPVCAFACGNSFSSFMLECSTMGGMTGGHSHGGSGMTSAECRANNTAYLTSLAWCMNTKCALYNVPTWLLQKYWEEHSTMDPTVLPKWDYTTALHEVTDPPSKSLTMGKTLNTTVLASQTTWDTQYRTMYFLTGESKYESIYGYVIFCILLTESARANLYN